MKPEMILIVSISLVKFETEGLLGYWNNDTSDDLRAPNGVIIPPDASPLTINKEFGMKCKYNSNMFRCRFESFYKILNVFYYRACRTTS